jgi:DNA-binding PadR family transcriptional regulator
LTFDRRRSHTRLRIDIRYEGLTCRNSRASLLQGTLDLLILKALSAGELHGLGVSRRSSRSPAGRSSSSQDRCFPALAPAGGIGWLTSVWEASENNRRAKYYTLTKAGKRQLGEATDQWNRVAVAMTRRWRPEVLARARSSLRNLVKRDRVERDLDDELQATLDLLIDEELRRGQSPAEARRVAVLRLGGIESVKEQVRDVRTGAFLDTVLGDIRFATRLLLRNPIFTLTAALSLAIGIGATTSIFTVANGLLLRSAVGVADPGRLVDITRSKNRGGPGLDPISYPDYLEVRSRATTLEGVYGYQLELQPASLRVENTGAERVYPGVVTTNYFDVLGVPAIAGRTFGVGDSEEAGSSPVVVLSHRFWARRFNSDLGVVGRTVYLNGYPFSVVGVAQEGFLGMDRRRAGSLGAGVDDCCAEPRVWRATSERPRGRLDDARWPFEAGRVESAGICRDRGDRRRPCPRVPGEVRLPPAGPWSD